VVWPTERPASTTMISPLGAEPAWAAGVAGATGAGFVACVACPLPAQRPASARAVALAPGARPVRERLWAGLRGYICSTRQEPRILAFAIQAGVCCRLTPMTFSGARTICGSAAGGKMRLVALVQEPEDIALYLRHLGLPTEIPPLAVPSGPRAYTPCPCPTRLRRARRRRYRVPPDAAQTQAEIAIAAPIASCHPLPSPADKHASAQRREIGSDGSRWAVVSRPDPPAPPHLPAAIVRSSVSGRTAKRGSTPVLSPATATRAWRRI
jgi:hypothetical protein